MQSCPEPGAALAADRRDLSYDVRCLTPIARCPRGSPKPRLPASWTIVEAETTSMRTCAGNRPTPVAPQGERVALGIAHPCTTFDKWAWMPIVRRRPPGHHAVRIHFLDRPGFWRALLA